MSHPFQSPVRSSGLEPDVLCLHATASSSRQFEPLREQLKVGFRTWAVDLAGHGERQRLDVGMHSLEREVAMLKPVLEALPGRVHVVGHSYGGAVALRLAREMPDRVASLTLYEPVLFRLVLDADDPAARQALDVANGMRSALAAGRGHDGARIFVDFWSGTGTYDALRQGARDSVVGRLPAALDCFDALFGDDTTVSDLHRIEVPTLVMSGTASPAAGTETAARVAHAIRYARWMPFRELGHMAPITRPQTVNAAIGEFLSTLPQENADRRVLEAANALEASLVA